MKNQKGFSLIELVIVVSVLAILAAVVAPQVNKLVFKSKLSRLQAEMKTMKDAFTKIYADTGVYPRDQSRGQDPGLMSNSRVPTTYRDKWEGPYLDRWPTEHPWGGTYDYNYGSYGYFNRDGTSGNEVWIEIRDYFTRDILDSIDDNLDDGNRGSGNIRHDGRNALLYYVGEGPRW